MAQDSTRSSKRPRYGSSDPIQGSAAMTTRTSPPREVIAEKPEETSILIGSGSTNSGRCRLRKGMVILKNFLPTSEQAELVVRAYPRTRCSSDEVEFGYRSSTASTLN